ncbi:MAG TPA: flagellar brake domain-containing protein [Sporolactobacillaceae bacterium]|nr:flagellar brake domain-containing protein [Sporolactobacillaceae bacterium]
MGESETVNKRMVEMLKVGESLYLERRETKDEIERYKTVIVGVNDREILVEIPINEKTKKFGYFSSGTTFEAIFYAAGKVYLFKTILIDRMQDKVPLLILDFPGMANMEVIQRRQHVRVEANLDIALHPLEREFEAFSSVTLDISGGGCAVHIPSSNKLKEGQDIQLWIVIPLEDRKLHYISVKASLIRLFQVKGQTRASFRFLTLSNSDRMQIIRFCFQREVALKKR